VLGKACGAHFHRCRREPPAVVHHYHRRARFNAVELGKIGCLGAVWDAEHEGVLGHAREVTGDDQSPAGAAPLPALSGLGGPPVGAVSPPLFRFRAEVGRPQ
jgi:hypothetical protein